MIITVSLNPAIDRTLYVSGLTVGGLNRVSESRDDPGGKGINVSKMLGLFDVENIAFGIIAGSSGEQLLRDCTALGLHTSFLRVSGETRTNIKLIDRLTSVTTEINGKGPELTAEDLENAFCRISSLTGSGDTVVFTGSLPAGAPSGLYRDWALRLNHTGVRIILDASGQALRDAAGAGIYAAKPNREELETLTGRPVSNIGDIIDAGRLLLQTGIRKLIVSLGAEGAVFFLDGKIIFAPPLSVPVRSTVGAGDSMVAALLYAESAGMSAEDTVRTTVAAASAAIMCRGTEVPSMDTVISLLPLVKPKQL